jgi:hypothetical protein
MCAKLDFLFSVNEYRIIYVIYMVLTVTRFAIYNEKNFKIKLISLNSSVIKTKTNYKRICTKFYRKKISLSLTNSKWQTNRKPPTNPYWALVVGYGPFSLCVIHKEGLCPSSGDINRLKMMMMNRKQCNLVM